MTDITQLDLYELLAVAETCSLQELTTGFRKKALTCHPDKFPNDEPKKEMFLLIKKALELLTDKAARNAYDSCRKQKKIHEERLSQMDATRKKFKQTLEKNEQRASKAYPTPTGQSCTDKLRAEVERIRQEGSRLVVEELERLHREFQEDKPQPAASGTIHLIIRFISNTSGYTDEELQSVFQKYGEISTIVNKGSKRALIEFNSDHISQFIENEKGLDGRPFASVRIQKPIDATSPTSSSRPAKKPAVTIDLTKPDFEDFEAMILRKMAEHPTTSS